MKPLVSRGPKVRKVQNGNTILTSNMGTSTIEDALEAVRQGKFVVVMDNEDRENEGDLIMPSELATEESLAFMIRHCSGVICTAITNERAKELKLPLMVPNNTEARQCKFTVSVDLQEGTTTGISAADRALTIVALSDAKIEADAFNKPGHVFPLLAQDGGVIERAGHTEASIDIARLAGCSASGFLCEINDDNGRMMRRPELEQFAATHNLPLITISDLIRYRFTHECMVRPMASLRNTLIYNTPHGVFHSFKYQCLFGEQVYEALVHGDLSSSEEEEVYVHFIEDGIQGIIDSQWAQKFICHHGRGVLLSISGRKQMVRVSGELMAQQSIFGLGMQVLRDLGIKSVKVLSSTLPKFELDGFGMSIVAHELLKTD